MVSIQRRKMLCCHKISGTHVGCQHALFDQHVSLIACNWHNFFDLAITAKFDAGFVAVKVQCTARLACCTKHFEKIVQPLHRLNNLCMLFGDLTAFIAIRPFN